MAEGPPGGERVLELVASQGGERVDRYIAGQVPQLSRSQVQRLIEEGLVAVEGQEVEASRRLREGERISVRIPPPREAELVAEDIPLEVAYEDQEIIVVDKPAGMVVHPSLGHPRGTLANALLAHIPDLSGVGGELRPGIVHRLDRDTSGLIVAAKSDWALHNLQAQFQAREVEKVYLALVEGVPGAREGIIEAPIGRDPRHRQRMGAVREGREARTRYRVLRAYQRHAFLEVRPETGRTHQVRVHLAFIGHPVVGDTAYGFKRPSLPLDRHFLHAHRLGFRLPGTGQWREFVSELPYDLARTLEGLEDAG
jgi:23S rRNA pseudouridine1911/1915/1917 synthase